MTQKNLASRLNISANQLSGKMNGKFDWKKREIDEILKMTNKSYEEIFLKRSTSKSKRHEQLAININTGGLN